MDYKGFLSKPINILLLISYESQNINQILLKPGFQLKICAFQVFYDKEHKCI